MSTIVHARLRGRTRRALLAVGRPPSSPPPRGHPPRKPVPCRSAATAHTADDGETGENDNVRTNIESIIGGSAGDTITGDNGFDVIAGGPGDDQLNGLNGDDLFMGGVSAFAAVDAIAAVGADAATERIAGGSAGGTSGAGWRAQPARQS